jgi:hypothetical protein
MASMRARGTAVLRLDAIEHSAHVLTIRWSVDDHGFTTTLRYPTVDLDRLGTQIGHDELARLLLHTALFEINKGVSLRPARIELGAWARFVTPALAGLWNEVVHRVWAQWRYEHGDPTYAGPQLRPAAVGSTDRPIVRVPPAERYLAFCGGGKDTLLALRLLAESGVEHDPYVYSSSVYGSAARQFALNEQLLAQVGRSATHRQSVHDEFLAMPADALRRDFGVVQVTSAETPSSVFAALPIVLAHSLAGIVVGHERSANTGNLVWSATGEVVNHQWGKSFAAERRLDTYIRDHLVTDFRYFSILAPIHDPLIFAMLADDDPAALAVTHSCNVRKPWCRRCAKCAYVWINYQAWLPRQAVDPMFGEANLLDDPANHEHFRRLLGLTERTPFECVGGVDETRLAFAFAYGRGLRGAAMDLFVTAVGLDHDWPALARRYLAVHAGPHALPASVATATLAAMRRGQRRAHDRVVSRQVQIAAHTAAGTAETSMRS